MATVDIPKIRKKEGETPSQFEEHVAQELKNIQAHNAAIRNDLIPLQIAAARQIEVPANGRSAVIIFVPYPQLQEYRKIQKTLVEELEKKFSGKDVVIIGQRTILSKNFKRNKKFNGPRPRSRTLTHVHNAILDDLVYPTEIVGKRTRVRTDGSKLLKVHLNPKDQVAVEGKLQTFSAVYKALCHKEVTFEFPSYRL
eukprot:gb/GECG01015643.1/.p1 GENE.gb/GECG01015643.1/~~gb/GECG01015643.1/.p1  ORF type:complete len:197 (+),score=27.64 gb/GECG01015643.1/:1-591(+)